MSHEPWDELLSDHVDGLLSAEEVERLERHLEECEECASTFRDYLSIREWARGFRPPSPSSDPWERIERSLGRRRNRMAPPRWAAVLAASVVVVVSGWIVSRGMGSQPLPELVPDPDGPSVVRPVVREPLDDASFAARVGELEDLYERAAGQLDPRTAAVVRQSLAEIDAALDRASSALATDPSNRLLRALLARSRAQKLDLLADVTGSL